MSRHDEPNENGFAGDGTAPEPPPGGKPDEQDRVEEVAVPGDDHRADGRGAGRGDRGPAARRPSPLTRARAVGAAARPYWSAAPPPRRSPGRVGALSGLGVLVDVGYAVPVGVQPLPLRHRRYAALRAEHTAVATRRRSPSRAGRPP